MYDKVNVNRSYSTEKSLHEDFPSIEGSRDQDDIDLAVFGKKPQLKVMW